MKTLIRIFIILAVFSVVAGALVTVVNAAGSILDRNGPNSRPQFQPDGNGGGGELRPPEGSENRPERRERDGGGFGSLRIVFGMAKNVIVIGFLVTMIVLPKSFFRKKKKKSSAGQ